jgi:hypothetical protein
VSPNSQSYRAELAQQLLVLKAGIEEVSILVEANGPSPEVMLRIVALQTVLNRIKHGMITDCLNEVYLLN